MAIDFDQSTANHHHSQCSFFHNQSGSSNVENLPPQVIRSVAKELRKMIADAPEGIRVILNEKDVTDIQAIIDGPTGTPYQGGAFRVRCVLGKEFPIQPPKAYFTTKVFHPNVSRNGEICVNTLKKDWKPDLGIKQILLVRIMVIFLDHLVNFASLC